MTCYGTFNVPAITGQPTIDTLNGPVTGSVFGTSSWSNKSVSASYAQSASYITSSKIVGIVNSSSYALTSSYATFISATYASNANFANFCVQRSNCGIGR